VLFFVVFSGRPLVGFWYHFMDLERVGYFSGCCVGFFGTLGFFEVL